MFGLKKKSATGVIATVDIPFEKNISRLFIFRCLWVIPVCIPFVIFSLWYGLLSFVHFFHMLLLGERSKSIYARQMEYIQYMAGWQGYLKYLTNGHPPVLPWEA